MRTLKVGNYLEIKVSDKDPEGPNGLGFYPKYMSGSIEKSNLTRLTCFNPNCNQPDCCFSCGMPNDNKEDVRNRLTFNGMMHGLESMALACAVAGIDVESPAFQEAFETVLQTAEQQFGD